MLDQPFTRPQAIATLMMFCFGSSAVVGVSTGVGQDSWISLTMSILFAAPTFWIYSRIISLNPGKGFFEVAELLLGKVAGKVVTALMSWYALHLCALVLRNFSEFIQISSLLETPQLPVLLIMGLTVYLLARNGCKALGKWSLAMMPVVLGIVAVTILFSLSVMDPLNFLPIFEHPFGDILKSSSQSFSFPFAETVLFLGIADFVRPSDSPAKIYLGSLVFTAVVLLLIVSRNLMILGPAVISVEYFPSYSAVRIINLGDFISRIEGSISVNFMLAGVTKVALCLIVASRGIASLFGLGDWRRLVAPTGLLAVMLAQIMYNSTMEMFAFIDYYFFYAIPFELILPILVWALSEIRWRKSGGKAYAPGIRETPWGTPDRGTKRPKTPRARRFRSPGTIRGYARVCQQPRSPAPRGIESVQRVNFSLAQVRLSGPQGILLVQRMDFGLTRLQFPVIMNNREKVPEVIRKCCDRAGPGDACAGFTDA